MLSARASLPRRPWAARIARASGQSIGGSEERQEQQARTEDLRGRLVRSGLGSSSSTNTVGDTNHAKGPGVPQLSVMSARVKERIAAEQERSQLAKAALEDMQKPPPGWVRRTVHITTQRLPL